MLKFDEAQRPSFTELSKLVLTSTENTIESPKGGAQSKEQDKQLQTGTKQTSSQQQPLDAKKVNKVYSMREFKKDDTSIITNDKASSKLNKKVVPTDLSMQPSQRNFEDSQANLMTQSELFKSYSEQ